ncbi:MAG: TonB-dependent receptor domain-containing protein [Chitinophagaceae bacterium]
MKNQLLPCILMAALLFTFGNQQLDAQQRESSLPGITLSVQGVPLTELLSQIEQQSHFRFAYDADLIALHKKITLQVKNIPLQVLLRHLFKGEHINYLFLGNQIILRMENPPAEITLSGYIKDLQSGETLPGATLFVSNPSSGTFSNHYGFYSITVPSQDSLKVRVSYMGYQPELLTIYAKKSQELDIHLYPKTSLMPEVVVTNPLGDTSAQIQEKDAHHLPAEMFHSSSSLNGTGDIIQSIKMLPGVQSGDVAGTSGLYIRGGNTDQNLIQMDEAQMYDQGHLFGLVSVFNSDMIKKAEFYKNGFPAQYGDHLSSVINIVTRDGNTHHLEGSIHLGSVASGLTLDGPLIARKASFLISARRSTLDLLYGQLFPSSQFSAYHFYDLNAKISDELNPNNHIFLSFYKGLDQGTYTNTPVDESKLGYSLNYGNTAMTFRWNHIFSGKLFSNTSLVTDHYHLGLLAAQNGYYAQLYSGISEKTLKTDFYYYPDSRQTIRMGWDILRQTLSPAFISDTLPAGHSAPPISRSDIPGSNAWRLAAFFGDQWTFTPQLSLYLGGRLADYERPLVHYLNFEPRLSLQYQLNPTLQVKTAYSRMHQYLDLVQGYNASFPAEIWIQASSLVPAQSSNQVSLGWEQSLVHRQIQAGMTAYYKTLDHQFFFKGGTQPTQANNLENDLIFGKGWDYGLEVQIQKNAGRLTGSIAYSLSYALLQFDSLNAGQSFPSAFNSRNNFFLSLLYQVNAHWKLFGKLVLASGRPFNQYPSNPSTGNENNPLYEGSSDNNGAPSEDSGSGSVPLNPYSRVDLGARYDQQKRMGQKKLAISWIFSVYNLLDNQNTNLVFRSIDPVTKQPVAKQLSFLPLIPSIDYLVKF